MASVAENFVAWLLADSAISDIVASRVDHNAPESDDGAFIFLQLTDTEYFTALDDPQGKVPDKYIYTVECWGRTAAEAQALADAVKAKHLSTGSFGGQTIQRIWLVDQNEEYVPKLDASEHGLHGEFLEARIIP